MKASPYWIFGMLGPNGAGKTSTLSAIEGLLKPQSGTVMVAGFDIQEKPLHARANVGVQLQATSSTKALVLTIGYALVLSVLGIRWFRWNSK